MTQIVEIFRKINSLDIKELVELAFKLDDLSNSEKLADYLRVQTKETSESEHPELHSMFLNALPNNLCDIFKMLQQEHSAIHDIVKMSGSNAKSIWLIHIQSAKPTPQELLQFCVNLNIIGDIIKEHKFVIENQIAEIFSTVASYVKSLYEEMTAQKRNEDEDEIIRDRDNLLKDLPDERILTNKISKTRELNTYQKGPQFQNVKNQTYLSIDKLNDYKKAREIVIARANEMLKKLDKISRKTEKKKAKFKIEYDKQKTVLETRLIQDAIQWMETERTKNMTHESSPRSPTSSPRIEPTRDSNILTKTPLLRRLSLTSLTGSIRSSSPSLSRPRVPEAPTSPTSPTSSIRQSPAKFLQFMGGGSRSSSPNETLTSNLPPVSPK